MFLDAHSMPGLNWLNITEVDRTHSRIPFGGMDVCWVNWESRIVVLRQRNVKDIEDSHGRK